MYFGKFALITYLFAMAAFGVGYILYTSLNWDLYGGYDTFEILSGVSERHEQSVNSTSTNPSFIFGDYAAAARAIGTILFDIPTGGQVANLWGSLGGILVGPQTADAVYVLLRLFITFSSACLIINIISGRDL